jgi:hypothetical protein
MARARIFRPAKTAMQSGARTRKWVLAYEPATRRRPEPLMGWTSAQDTLNEVELRFDTVEEAVAFANRNELDYTIMPPQLTTEKPKSYADNFRYDRIRG